MTQPIILCVDDEKIVLNSLKAELKEILEDKFLIETADSGEEALDLVKEALKENKEVPLVISDYIMPNIKGDELLKMIHEISPNTNKVMLTGQATLEGVTNAINWANLYRYIAKPWETKDLALTVGTAISSFYKDIQLEEQNKQLININESLEQKVIERTKEIVDKNKLLEFQKNDLDIKNRNITASIQYAKLIQRAILPSKELIEKLFPESFVFFKPKSIVSGDIYWLIEKNNQILIAAVDCTGHGVPGAFVSIIASNLLNQAVKEQNITKPSEILNFLNKGVNETMRVNDPEWQIRDGMDLALCNINPQTLQMEYSGANNPVVIVRNNQIIELKPDRHSIGDSFNENFQTYSNEIIQLQKGDCIYLFSDGFADQFGGIDGKKYLKKNLIKLFLEINKNNMPDQKNLLFHALKEWQGNYEQIDDVMIIGIKI